ncbi:tRNA-splicing ligase RtcB [Desulfobotulus alkaliphilus]|uniref:3'-phosphate/5'-hydroxy nucleic acid ligase n=1 Tax=Desulfobotulus alkaliphilus TaxID=622671 RepID=A0A562S7V7_9BACT|nr:RtcB family protein [Desulfobotulus alkaliphilus]TWI77253.1 tRNA-splicing ligase RtcB [Desulfobotulus alkaliphilus]
MSRKASGIPLRSWCQDPEDLAMEQAENLCRHPRAFHHIALMPDCHPGYGMPIGGVAAFRNAIIPNAVGVDIGCGMGAAMSDFTGQPERKTLVKITETITSCIPAGFNRHKQDQKWEGFDSFLENLSGKPGWLGKDTLSIARQSLGTLGGGNHFIEIQKDGEDRIWVMLHSGSRNLGKTIAEYHHRKALAENRKDGIVLPSEDLAFFDTDSARGMAYIRDMHFALNFAKENRRRMMDIVKKILGDTLGCSFLQEINIHHNYAAEENHFGCRVWVHRKGATSAQKGEKGIIPGSMGSPSYIVEGLGNPESFCSCSHGAGRVMGRNEACRKLDAAAVAASMKGIVHGGFPTMKKGNLRGKQDFGEAPGAYKDIDTVMAAQADLVKILVKLQPLAVVKG